MTNAINNNNSQHPFSDWLFDNLLADALVDKKENFYKDIPINLIKIFSGAFVLPVTLILDQTPLSRLVGKSITPMKRNELDLLQNTNKLSVENIETQLTRLNAEIEDIERKIAREKRALAGDFDPSDIPLTYNRDRPLQMSAAQLTASRRRQKNSLSTQPSEPSNIQLTYNRDRPLQMSAAQLTASRRRQKIAEMHEKSIIALNLDMCELTDKADKLRMILEEQKSQAASLITVSPQASVIPNDENQAPVINTDGEPYIISIDETARHLLENHIQEHEGLLNQLLNELTDIHGKLQETDIVTAGEIYGLMKQIDALKQVKVLQNEASTSACLSPQSSSSSIPVAPPLPGAIPPPPGVIPPPPPPPPPVETASQKITKLLVVFNKLAENLTQDESIFNEVIAELTEIKISNRQEATEKESFFNRYKEIILNIKDQKINEKINEISRLQGEQSQASVDRRDFHSRATALEQEKKQANYQSFQALNKELKSLRVSLESNEKSLASYADGLDKLRNASRMTRDGVECMQAKNEDGLVIIPLEIYSRKLKEIEEDVIHCRNQCATLAPKIPSLEEKLAASLSQNPHFQNLEEEIMACKGQATYCSNRALDLGEQIKKEERNLNRLRIERTNFSKKTINVSIATASTSAEAEPSTPRTMDLASQLKSRKANLSKKTEIKVDDEIPVDDGETSKPKIDLSTISSSRGSLRRIPKEVKASTSTSDLLAMLGSST